MITFLLAQTSNWVPSGTWLEFIAILLVTWIPTLVPLALLILLIIWVTSQSKCASRIRKRSYEHMDRMEAKTDEMIILLKEIRNKQ
jgi:hypothetical protein